MSFDWLGVRSPQPDPYAPPTAVLKKKKLSCRFLRLVLRFATSTCPPTVQQSRGRAQANTRPRFGAKRSGAWYLGFPLQHLQTGCSGSPAACFGPAHRIAHTTRSHPAGGERTAPPQWRGSTRPGTRLACGKHKQTQHTAACTPGVMKNDSAFTFNSLHPPCTHPNPQHTRTHGPRTGRPPTRPRH